MLNTRVKKLLFGFLMAMLMLPALQAKLHFAQPKPLNGYFEKAPHPQLRLSDPQMWQQLSTNTYQEQLEHYLEDRLGFREFLIRLRNQLDYWVFHKTNAIDVVLGQNHVLFQGGPVVSYLGQDFLGYEHIGRVARRARAVQDDLARRGTQLLFVIAPGKPAYLPEYLPEGIQKMWPGVTNYTAFAWELPKAGVNLLDARALFARWKDTASFPLFPRGGTHWSGYGVTLVADTLFRRIEHLTGTDLPDFHARGRVVTTTPRNTDEDIASGLNLLQGPTPWPMAYPFVKFASPQAGQRRINALIIGDSFSQSFYGFYPYYPALLDTRSRLWYYNQQIYWPMDAEEDREVHRLNLQEQLAGRDLIMLVTTEQNLAKGGFGFLEEAYKLFHPYTAEDHARVQQLEQELRRDRARLKKFTQQATEQGIPVDSLIRAEATSLHDKKR